MLMNNLDPEVAEHPDDLIVYGGSGKAARNWACFDAIVALAARRSRTTRRCSCSRASRSASSARTTTRPRVLIANANLVPRVGDLGRASASSSAQGLTMYGQMTAGSWIYIGTQGILQGTYETFADAGARSASAARSRGGWSSPPGSAAWAARSRSPSR